MSYPTPPQYGPPGGTNGPLPSQPRRTSPVVAFLLLAVGFLLAITYVQWQDRQLHDPDAKPRVVTPRGDLSQEEQSTIELFRDHADSVVFITTTKIRRGLFRFDEQMMSQGAGSGFVWDKQGHIVTNDHVIADADEAYVTLADQSVWKARLVGRAPGKDLAVVKIDAPAERLQPILVGTSSNLQVGQKVFAIGNPFGLDHTLTTGIISALDREISTTERGAVEAKRTVDGVIQTDAAINPGNSGGPLLDSAGRLIGVNTAIYSPSGAYAGVGFAIPVDNVNRIVPELIRHGRIIRPGIGIVPFGDQTTEQLGVQGVLVKQVIAGTPAEGAGLQATRAVLYRSRFGVMRQIRFGDLIVKADDKPIKNLNDWFSLLETHQPGDEIRLTLMRDIQSDEPQQVELVVPLADPRWE